MLVNFVYCHPVGHAIEALHYANGYHAANPSTRISVALNKKTPTELASLCPFIEHTYPIDVNEFDGDTTPDLSALPSTWDWIVADGRGADPMQRQLFPGLGAYYDACERLEARQGRGFAGYRRSPAYQPGLHFRLTLPASRTPWPGGGPRIALLPGGSAPRSYYPSTRSWRLVISALLARFPDATFCLVGKLRADGRTSTTLDRAELDALLAAMPSAVDVVDAPLIEQLATVAECDVLVSPHSGFGMAALAAGTPWLTLGGNKWPEYYFNGVPFHTVIPDVRRFPCYQLFEPDPPDVDDDGVARAPSMSRARIEADLEEIVDGTARLVAGQVDYETALRDHARKMSPLVGPLWSIDDALGTAVARL